MSRIHSLRAGQKHSHGSSTTRERPIEDAHWASRSHSTGRHVPIAPDPALPAEVQMLLKSLETPANLPLARELWMANAAPLLK